MKHIQTINKANLKETAKKKATKKAGLTSRVSAMEKWKQSVLAGETTVMIFEKEE